jgi:hypothetical protein
MLTWLLIVKVDGIIKYIAIIITAATAKTINVILFIWFNRGRKSMNTEQLICIYSKNKPPGTEINKRYFMSKNNVLYADV